MHLSQSYQIKPEQITVRDTAQLYLKIQQNTQFLTNLLRHQFGRQRPTFNIETQQIDVKSFFNAIVQVSYLLYFCTIKKIALFLSRSIYVNSNRQSPQIVFQFILEKQMMNLSEQNQRYLHKLFFYVNPYKHDNSYAFCLIQFIKNTLQVLRVYIDKHKDKKILNDKILMKHLQNFTQAINLLQPQIKQGLKPKTLISCLQQTQLFRVHSGLLKTLNASIYENIRKTDKIKQIICDIKRQEIKLGQMIQQIKQNPMSEIQIKNKQQKIIQQKIQSLFEYLNHYKLIQFEPQVGSNKSIKVTQKHEDDTIIKFQIKVETKGFRKFTQALINQLQSSGTCSKLEQQSTHKYSNFQINIYLKRRLICIKYLVDAQINAQNYDVILYHCNNMMNRWENASMELIQRKRSDGKKKQKIFAFKVISHFFPKDSPFINILLGIDMAMIYGKISQGVMNQEVIRLDDHAKFTLTGKKIEHLSCLFIKKIKRLYENLALKAI